MQPKRITLRHLAECYSDTCVMNGVGEPTRVQRPSVHLSSGGVVVYVPAAGSALLCSKQPQYQVITLL